MGIQHRGRIFWVELGGHEVGMAWDFHNLNELGVWVDPGGRHASRFVAVEVGIVELVTVTVAL